MKKRSAPGPGDRARFFAALSRALQGESSLPAALSALSAGETGLPEAFRPLILQAARLGGLGPAMGESGLFSPAQCTLVTLAEGEGRLAALCPELESDCRREERLLSEIQRTAEGVARAGLIMLGVFILLMGIVLPLGIRALDGLALSLGKSRPLMPRIVGSGGLGLAAAALICLAGFLLLFYSRQRGLAVEWSSRLSGGMRALALKVSAARFFQGLVLGRAGGLPLREAIYLAAGRIENPLYQQRLARAVELLEGGSPFADAAGEAGLLPKKEQAELDRGLGAEALAFAAFEGALSAVPAFGAAVEKGLALWVCAIMGLGVLAAIASLFALL